MALLPDPAYPPVWRTLFVLGRVSNLPTVATNCTAAWLLAGGGDWTRLAVVCTGGSLLYTGGMFLNDAFDSKFDARFRPERPIPSGRIAARSVFLLGALMIGAGVILIALLQARAGWWALALALCIVLYDAVHKRTVAAPVLMALCRFLLYLTAAAAASSGITRPVWVFGAALGVYIIGVSALARHESTGTSSQFVALPLLLAPLIAALWVNGGIPSLLHGLLLAVFVTWTFWCIQPVLARRPAALARAIPGLLAGITLGDSLAAQSAGTLPITFLLLFAATLVLQKIVPAT